MRTLIVVVLVSFGALALAGCSADSGALERQSEVDRRLVTWPSDEAITSALVSQHTLFPYHFVTDAPLLNDLGKKDLAVLAQHFREHKGQLSVRRGGASNELYEARVAEVLRAVSESGIDKERVAISDSLPGGEGMPSERVLAISQGQEKGKSSATYAKPASGSGMQTKEGQ